MARTVGFFHNGSQGTFDSNFTTLTNEMNNLARQKDAAVQARFAADQRSKSADQHLDELVAEKPVVLIAAGGPPAALADSAALPDAGSGRTRRSTATRRSVSGR